MERLFEPSGKQVRRREKREAEEAERRGKKARGKDARAVWGKKHRGYTGRWTGNEDREARVRAALDRRLDETDGCPVDQLCKCCVEARRAMDKGTYLVALAMVRERVEAGAPVSPKAAMGLALSGSNPNDFARGIAAACARLGSPEDKAASGAFLACAEVADERVWRALGDEKKKRRRLWDQEALVALWDYSKSIPKITKVTTTPFAGKETWPPTFADTSLPLLVDVGCGFGACATTFAAHHGGWNVLGCDRADHALAYARGIASRSPWEERCAFMTRDANDVLRWVREAYAGEARWILLQFPTPYAVGDEGKNAQLPPSAASPKFMCNAQTLTLAARACAAGGRILVASNVEDVAVTVREALDKVTPALKPILEAPPSSNPADHGATADNEEDLPLRTRRWIAKGGARARGKGWLATSILPFPARSETEAFYEAKGKPIHRCAYTKA